MLVPDWLAVADRYGGVHRTLGGLLTASHVTVESAAGWTYLWAHETEATYWLHDVLVDERRISDITAFMSDGSPDDNDRYIRFRVSDRGYSVIRSWKYGRERGRSVVIE